MKNTPKTFLDPDELDKFTDKKAHLERSVIETSHKFYASKEAGAKRKFSSIIEERLKKLLKREKKWFECICVRIHENDGITWAAEKAKETVKKIISNHYKLILLGERAQIDSLPLISSVLGVDNFLSLAYKKNFTSRYISTKSFAKYAIIGSIIVLEVLYGFLSDYQKQTTQAALKNKGSFLDDPGYYIILIVMVLVSIITRHIIPNMPESTRAKSIDKFLDALKNARNTESNMFEEFIDSLAVKLSREGFPRIIIIDNYEALDFTTKKTLKRYYNKYVEKAAGSEMWIVCEKRTGDGILNDVIQNSGNYTDLNTTTYEQLLLTQEEKEKLVKTLHRPPESVQFATIKAVCKGEEEGGDLIYKKVSEYRIEHPCSNEKYDLIAYLCLLSLTSAPANIFLSERYLIKGFIAKSRMRAMILQLYLKNTLLRKDEFEKNFTLLRQCLADMLLYNDESGFTRFYVKPEVCSALCKYGDKLNLPKAGLGHLFWALFWYDQLQARPLEALWIRKLAHHLIESELIEIKDPEEFEAVVNRFFEAILFALDACMQVCVFESINPLLDKIFTIFDDEQLLTKTSYRKRIFRKCWEAYLLLGDERILTHILNVYYANQTGSPSIKSWENPLEKLFFDTMRVLPEKRDLLNSSFLLSAIGESENGISIKQYAFARSFWFLAILEPYFHETIPHEYIVSIELAKEQLPDVVSSAIRRISSVNDPFLRFVDYMTLPTLIWAAAMSIAVPMIIFPAGIETEHNLFNEEFIKSQGIKIDLSALQVRNLTTLIQLIEDSVTIASYMSEKSDKKRGEDFKGMLLNEALVKEICGVSIASIIIVIKKYNDSGIFKCDETTLKRLFDIIVFANGILNYTFPEIRNQNDVLLPEFTDKAKTLLEFSCFIWDRFGLERQHSLTKIRQTYFWGVLRNLDAGIDGNMHEEAIKKLGVTINNNDFSGLAANITVANILRSAAELSAYYLCKAGSISLQPVYSESLKDNLSFLILINYHNLRINFTLYLKTILECAEKNSASSLNDALIYCAEKELPALYLSLINVLNKPENKQFDNSVLSKLTNNLEKIKSESVKDELSAMLELTDIKEKLSHNVKIDFKEYAKAWEKRKELWIYSSFLLTLMYYEACDESIFNEIINLLDRDPAADTWNSYLLLATEICHIVEDERYSGDISIPIRYLSSAIIKWEPNLSTDEILGIYNLLYRLDKINKDNYIMPMIKWQTIKIQRDHLKKIPELLQIGAHFLVFEYYYNIMWSWGLALDIEQKQFAELMRKGAEEKRSAAMQWKKQGAAVPEPFAEMSGKIINSQFLVLGRYLFDEPLESEPFFDNERVLFNNAALSALPELIETICFLPSLPESIKSILQKYSNRFKDYTMID